MYDEDFKSPRQPEDYLKHTKGHVCYDPAKVRTCKRRWPHELPTFLDELKEAPFQR